VRGKEREKKKKKKKREKWGRGTKGGGNERNG
jgi:hypothetical protein